MKKLKLKQTLDELYSSYLSDYRCAPEEFFSTRRDPILFPHRYSSFEDIEAAAFLASTFAYGNVKSLCAFADRLLTMLGPSPATFLKRGPTAVDELAKHKPYYRFHKSVEILAVLAVLARIYRSNETLYSTFLKSYDSNRTMKEVQSDFIRDLRSRSEVPLKFLLPLPEDGSTCKRMNLFLRWMVRRDGIDFGLWKEIPPSFLIMPTDTHIGRIAYRFRWIKTPSLSWAKAEQITNVLRKFDPEDPTRYDFSLCHESISKTDWFRRISPQKR